MKRLLWPALALAGACLSPAAAQQGLPVGAQILPGAAPESVCILQATAEDMGLSIAPPSAPGKTGTQATATFNVNYIDADAGEPWPAEAQTAFAHAVDIWSTHVASSVTINVDATWAGLGGCNIAQGVTLGAAGASFVLSDFGAGMADTWYPIALAEALVGSNFVPGSADIVARFNRACDDPGNDLWYFGTDGNPGPGKIDFVSVVLHEIGHGLGFAGNADVDDGAGSGGAIECDGVAGNGCFSDPPGVYDRFVTDSDVSGTSLLETATYPSNSSLLGNALLGMAGDGVFFDGAASRFGHGGTAPQLYTPTTWDPGSSYSHLDSNAFDGTQNALMTPSIGTNEAVHAPGPVMCGIFQDMGWPMGDDCASLLPVELVRFEAVADAGSVRLSWDTAGERNNAGFHVEHRTGDAPFEAIAFVPGNGTSDAPHAYGYTVRGLAPGRHAFRLKQVDFDGAFEWSEPVAVTLQAPTAVAVSDAFPNPFNPQTQFTVAVQADQHVRIGLYNVLGARVADVFEGQLAAHEAHRFTVEASHLPSGLYLIRVEGQSALATQTVTLMK